MRWHILYLVMSCLWIDVLWNHYLNGPQGVVMLSKTIHSSVVADNRWSCIRRTAIGSRVVHDNARLARLDDMDWDVECPTQRKDFRLPSPNRSVAYRLAVSLELLWGHETSCISSASILPFW